MGERWGSLELRNFKKLPTPIGLRDKGRREYYQSLGIRNQGYQEGAGPLKEEPLSRRWTLELSSKNKWHRGNTSNCQKPKLVYRGNHHVSPSPAIQSLTISLLWSNLTRNHLVRKPRKINLQGSKFLQSKGRRENEKSKSNLLRASQIHYTFFYFLYLNCISLFSFFFNLKYYLLCKTLSIPGFWTPLSLQTTLFIW